MNQQRGFLFLSWRTCFLVFFLPPTHTSYPHMAISVPIRYDFPPLGIDFFDCRYSLRPRSAAIALSQTPFVREVPSVLWIPSPFWLTTEALFPFCKTSPSPIGPFTLLVLLFFSCAVPASPSRLRWTSPLPFLSAFFLHSHS